jgi:hypothetical protein
MAIYDKMREIRERVRLGPAWKKQVEKDPDPIEPGIITIGAWINQMRFQATICRRAVDMACNKELTKNA